MNTNVKSLIVKYHNRTVGYLRLSNSNKVTFQYDTEWIENGFSISPYVLPLSNKIFTSNKIELNYLFGVFCDCLPQVWGQKIIQKKLNKMGIDYRRLNMLTKLTFTTNQARGALRFEPTQINAKFLKIKDLDAINLIAQKLIKDCETEQEQETLFIYSSVSGGAKPKIHIDLDGSKWIIKLNVNTLTTGFEEYKANQLAQKCGINTNEFKLFSSKQNQGYFGTKRFDIDVNGNPIHTITLCGLLETAPSIPNLDYANLFQAIQTICFDKTNDLYEAFRRMVFNVYFGNKDDHGCNWSFLYDEKEKSYKLSPFYDITNTGNLFPEHELAVLGNGNPTDTDMLNLAKKFNLSNTKCKQIINNIKNILNIK